MADFLFLDFDGVINRSNDHIGRNHILPIHDPSLERVTKLVKERNLTLVISSSHRKLHVTPETLRSRLGDLVDHCHPDWKTGSDRKGHRGNEVRQWILDHAAEVDRYLILDDDSDFYVYQPFLKIDHHFGFTDLVKAQAEAMLDDQVPSYASPLTPICHRVGDLIDSRCIVIAHGCNAQGKMRSGVAKAIREAHPEAYEVYMRAYEDQGLALGSVNFCESDCKTTYCLSRWILNIITQQYYGYDGKKYVSYEAMYDGLEEAARIVSKELGFYEIGIPRIGSDRGGGDWDKIEADILHPIGQHSGVKFTVFTLPQVPTE